MLLVPSLLLGLLALAPQAASQPSGALLDGSHRTGLVDVSRRIADVQLDIKYASTQNFTGVNLYGDFRQCLLQEAAAAKLVEADRLLKRRRPELHFVLYDCLRPHSVQQRMWQVVKGTPQQSYVADPGSATGSIHNYGCAVDLSLADAHGQVLDMGTAFDHLGPLAQPRRELSYLRKGQLSAAQVANRLLLREVMLRAGFEPINSEWWHFNAFGSREVRRRYRRVP